MPGVEMLRMTSSGTEAAMSAIRLARAATGRDKVLKFAGAYHGHVDGLLAEAGSGPGDAGGIPASPGVPASATADTVIVAVERRRRPARGDRAPRARRDRAEPYPANMGLVPPRRASSSCCASGRDATGALLVFDEVITGFRVARGGAQELTGVVPDLTVLGKVIGGGLPAAAYGGSRALMERIAPAGDVYQAGTLSGNPLAVAAGLATLRLLDEDAYTRLGATTEALARGLREAAAAASVPVQVVTAPGLLTVFFSPAPVRDLAGAQALRPGRPRLLVPRAARARRLPAAVAVRGVVPVAGTPPRARRAHRRGGGGRVRGAVSGAPTTAETLARLHAELRAGGGLLGAALREPAGAPPADDAALGARAAAARAAGHREDLAFVVEAIREGYLLHYGRPRLLRDDDRDLALLAGDHLYAVGLARLAALGDIDAVAELADVIALCAQAHAEGRPELAEAVWEAGATAVGWPADGALAAAKAAARDGAPGAAEKLRVAARRVGGDVAPDR